MSEEVTAGGKEFAFAMLWAAGLYFVCGVIMSLCRAYLPGYYFSGGIISIIIFCIFGYFVMTRYSARFTYTLKGGKLRINRTIGKRNKELEFDCGAITDISCSTKPAGFPSKPYNMHKTVVVKKRRMYITFTSKEGRAEGVIIEPSEKLKRHIEKERDRSAVC